MSDITVNVVRSSVENDVQEFIAGLDKYQLEINADMDKADILEALNNALEDFDLSYSVDYYYEAWCVVAGSDFNEYTPDEELNFEDCTSSFQALMIEAQAIINAAVYSFRADILEEIADRFCEICETASGWGFGGLMTVSQSDNYGWNSHTYETDEGTCVHKNIEEYGLFAVVGNVGSLHLSACFTVEQ